MIVKTTILIRSALEHQILEWAINSDVYEETQNGELPGWRTWDRTGVLTSERLLINSETPEIKKHMELILQRLQGLQDGAKDKYAQIAKNLESRLRRVNEGLLRSQPAKLKTAAAHG
jgi:hypothetical protein